MASRVAEEEQTQRVMIALNDMRPFYPGKKEEEIRTILDEVRKGEGEREREREGGGVREKNGSERGGRERKG